MPYMKKKVEKKKLVNKKEKNHIHIIITTTQEDYFIPHPDYFFFFFLKKTFLCEKLLSCSFVFIWCLKPLSIFLDKWKMLSKSPQIYRKSDLFQKPDKNLYKKA